MAEHPKDRGQLRTLERMAGLPCRGLQIYKKSQELQEISGAARDIRGRKETSAKAAPGPTGGSALLLMKGGAWESRSEAARLPCHCVTSGTQAAGLDGPWENAQDLFECPQNCHKPNWSWKLMCYLLDEQPYVWICFGPGMLGVKRGTT